MNERKDELAQVYYVNTTLDGTLETNHRHYIYSQAKKEAGGLYVNARALKSEEKVSNGIGTGINAVQFRFNRNEKITQECKIVYRGSVYDVDSIDPFDFRSVDMKVRGKETVDNTTYGADEYDG